MGLYKKLIRPILFALNAERAHYISFSFLKLCMSIFPKKLVMTMTRPVTDKRLSINLLGIEFPNRIGLAAGFDKDAKLFSELSQFGFGFIEVGTVTPLPQKGNPKPRMFRLLSDEAIINRMGFNNEGIDKMIGRLKRNDNGVVIGGNIGKNKLTDNENAFHDYEICFRKLFPFVDYFVVNVSSPNTPGLRDLQEKKPLHDLLVKLQGLNYQLTADSQISENPKPVLLKISPDLSFSQLDDVMEVILATGIQGVIATNTTLSRDNLQSHEDLSLQAGGLSGKPLLNRSNEIINYLKIKSNGSFVIIGSGGILTADDALAKLDAGADLIQLYTGFIYEGPSLLKRINNALLNRLMIAAN